MMVLTFHWRDVLVQYNSVKYSIPILYDGLLT